MSLVEWADAKGVRLKTNARFVEGRLDSKVFQFLGRDARPALVEMLKRGCPLAEVSAWLREHCGIGQISGAWHSINRLFLFNYARLEFFPWAGLEISGRHDRVPFSKTFPEPDKALVLSRFAYFRGDGGFVLECPFSGLRCRIFSKDFLGLLFDCSEKAVEASVWNGQPEGVRELLGILLQTGVLRIHPDGPEDRREALWDFHDLLFFVQSDGDYGDAGVKNVYGGVYKHRKSFDPPDPRCEGYPGSKIPLPPAGGECRTPFDQVLRGRKSVRSYDCSNPLSRKEIGAFLGHVCRAPGRVNEHSRTTPHLLWEPRAYASGGGIYEQELYLWIGRSRDLARGFYHYDCGAHALVALPAENPDRMERSLKMPNGELADATFFVSTRFQRLSWKYSSMSLSLLEKNTGCLIQTMYFVATAMGLAPCAKGGGYNNKAFARITGKSPYEEACVGVFFLGRASGV